jgi:beta-lactamase regulating signal transducer with metallopeptidase domain
MIPVLIEAALRALVVALAVGIGLRILQVRNVLAQKVAWGLVLAASLAMPWIMRWQGLPASAQIHLTQPAWLPGADSATASIASSASANSAQPLYATKSITPAEPAAQLIAGQQSMPVGGGRYPAPVRSSTEFSVPAHVQEVEAETPATLWNKVAATASQLPHLQLVEMLALAYSAVSGLLLLRLLFGLSVAAKLWLAAQPVEPGMIANIAAGLHLRASAAVFSPVTIGSGVVLPEDFAEWDAEKLRIVLAHERSHIRQGDFYLQMVAGVYAAVFWFSPLGWWLKRQLSDLGEAISDRAGLQEAASRASYAQVLLEFAAMPRPTLTGVAMARTTNLSNRIERLLNDKIFRQSFAASRRALLVGLLFPLALIAATSMIRVQAAGQTPPPAPPQAPSVAPASAPVAPEAPLTGVSDPDALPAPAPMAAPMPAPPAAPNIAPPTPPTGLYGEIHDSADEQDTTTTNTTDKNGHSHSTSVGRGYSYSYSSDGDSWAVVTGPNQHISFSGEWNGSTREAIEKARKMSSGKFLWFTHGGKSYMIDDPAVVAQIELMYKPMAEFGAQQEELGRQQEKLGHEQELLAKAQSLARVPTPDMSREIARVDEAMAKLKVEKNAQVSQEELAEIQGKLADLQGRLGEIQGRIGDKMGDFGEKQGHLGELQGKLGEQQGRLGEQEGKLAEEADRKVKSIIDQSLGNGKARPVE